MSYTAISDFKYGMDRRRPQSSGVPGTLWLLKNAVITRGGDIERAKKFAAVYNLPPGTHGYFSVRRQRYVFGHTPVPAGMPIGIRYQQLAAPGNPAMTAVLDAKAFDGKVYAIAAYEDGNIYHFYDGARVTDWDTLASGAASFESVAERLAALIDAETAYRAIAFGAVIEITAEVPGVPFTIATSTHSVSGTSTPTAVATEVQANVAAVAEVRATGSITITGGTPSPGVNQIVSAKVNGVELLGRPINWVDSNDATANALSVEINNYSSVHGYVASAAGAVVTLQAPVGSGATPNGHPVAVGVEGDVTATTANMSGGVTKVDPVAQVYTVTIGSGTFAAADRWTITLDGTVFQTTGLASATGTSLYINKSRMYSGAGSLWRYSKINDATNWTDTNVSSGAGFINLANETDGAVSITGAARYDAYTAIFTPNVIIIYDLQADAEQSVLMQTVDNTGTFAPRSIVSYGANDVYYLDETGIRSLRMREVVAAAHASDVGSAFDTFIQEIFAEVGEHVRSNACAVIEAIDGRFMLSIGPYVVVLSYFPSSKIVAWSYVDFGQEISDMVRVGRNIELRAGDTIYAYGGRDGDEYPEPDEFPITAVTPYISAKDPAGHKVIKGFDMAAVNTWRVRLLTDPNNPKYFTDIGFIRDTTYNRVDIKLPGYGALFALEFKCTAGGFASLSSTAVHADTAEQN